MIGDPEVDGRVTLVPSFWARVAERFRRAWATEKGRRRIVVSAGTVVTVVIVAVVVSLFASLAGESQSYRDGYSAGGSAYTSYAAYSTTNITGEEACKDEEAQPGTRPASDNPAQWIKGCVDSFNQAESDN
jgi:threonine/homoserine/homoserine lactone efflux protein